MWKLVASACGSSGGVGVLHVIQIQGLAFHAFCVRPGYTYDALLSIKPIRNARTVCFMRTNVGLVVLVRADSGLAFI